MHRRFVEVGAHVALEFTNTGVGLRRCTSRHLAFWLLLALFVVLVVTAVSLIPASAAQKDVELGEEMRTGAGVLACGAVASLVCAQLRLQKESLAWSDLC